MILSNRNGLKNTRNMLRVFGGLNETYSCTEAEYSAGINFSARNFPALSTRLPRRKLREEADLNGMYHLNGLLTVCGRDLVYTPDDADEMEVTLKDAVEDGKKTLVGIGTKILIFPDKLAFDTASRKVSALGAVWSGKNASVEFAPCDAEGKVYEVSGCGPAEPDKPTDGQLFLRVEDPEKPWSSESTLEVYSEASGNWSAVVLDYCRISAKGVGTDFAAEDTVTLTGSAAEQAGQWNELDGDRIVYDAGADALRVKADPGGEWFYGRLTRTGAAVRWVSLDGSVSREFVSAEVVELERRVPDMDYLTECDNRVWGCSNKENVIYACKLGDPTNWFSYRGIAADSYAVTVGSDGAFTGAATCMGYALFFKENTLHKLYQALGFPAQQPALPGRGKGRCPEPLRHQRDALLSLARRRDGLGRQHPHQSLDGPRPGPAAEREVGAGRRAGRAVLSAPRAGQRRSPGRAAAGLRHRTGALAGGRCLLLRDGRKRRAALSLGRKGHLGRRCRPGGELAAGGWHRGRRELRARQREYRAGQPGRAVSLPADAPARGRGEEPHRGGGELRQRSVGDTGPADRRRAALLRCSVCAEAVREPAVPAEGQRSAHPAQPDPDERRREGWHSGTGGELNMASVTGLSKIGLPHLSENMDAEDARAIRNYLYQMQEQLQYVLCNLDVENMSEPLRARLNSIQ
jgi:hypothetical protein